MGSYIVRSRDIAETIKRLDDIARRQGGQVPIYERDIVPLLGRPENRRIQYFYYCDNREGITVRVYDGQFGERNPTLRYRERPVLYRAEELGTEDGPAKREMLRAWDGYEKAPRDVNTNNTEAAERYFGSRNGDDVQDHPFDITSPSFEDSLPERYRSLWKSTYLGGQFFSRFEEILNTHRQLILEGPPGSGKTWVAREFAKWWTDPQSDAEPGSRWDIVQLHESYGYEDFFQGIRPILLNSEGKEISPGDTTTPVDKLVYGYAEGIFRRLCKDAESNPKARFVLIIDEINRGKTSRIFGELLYLLEYRQECMTLASGERFSVPKNVYLIGTMNTADRSIALVDYALRRRFRFLALKPYQDERAPVLGSWLADRNVRNRDDIVRWFCALNRKVCEINEHLVVGHSYFMLASLDSPDVKDFPRDSLIQVWNEAIIPLLGEYLPGKPYTELVRDYGLDTIQGDAHADSN